MKTILEIRDSLPGQRTPLASGLALGALFASALLVSACDDDSRAVSTSGGGGTTTEGGTTVTEGEGDESDESTDSDSGEGEGTPTVENSTPGCYGIEGEGITEVDLAGLELAPYPDGLLPGEPCEFDDECLYGLCTSDSILTQGQFKICVKLCNSCSPSGKGPACSWDNDFEAGIEYTCVIGNFGGGSQSHCGRRCSDTGDCDLLTGEYTSCNSENAGQNYCGAWN